MFVSVIKVAILALSGHEPFPDACQVPVSLEYFTGFDQFVQARADIYIDCDFFMDEDRISRLSKLSPAQILVNAVAVSAGELPETFTRFNGWPGFGNGQVLELAAGKLEIPETVLQFAMACGLTCIPVPNQAGMVRPRVVAMIINEAYHALEEGVSSANEIDIAMKLGTSYPYGPFEWAELISLQKIVNLLNKLAESDVKYQPATCMVAAVQKLPWLKS